MYIMLDNKLLTAGLLGVRLFRCSRASKSGGSNDSGISKVLTVSGGSLGDGSSERSRALGGLEDSLCNGLAGLVGVL